MLVLGELVFHSFSLWPKRTECLILHAWQIVKLNNMVIFIESLPCYSLVLRDSFIANYKIILMLLNTQGELACGISAQPCRLSLKALPLGASSTLTIFFLFFFWDLLIYICSLISLDLYPVFWVCNDVELKIEYLRFYFFFFFLFNTSVSEYISQINNLGAPHHTLILSAYWNNVCIVDLCYSVSLPCLMISRLWCFSSLKTLG